MGFIIRGFIWDIPILIFVYVRFGALSKTGFQGNHGSNMGASENREP